MTRLILIRHGQTYDNQAKRYCGVRDSGLSEQGRAQAAEMGNMLRDTVVDAVYVSDLNRAIDTASIIFPEKPIIQERAFREMDFGVFEGLTYHEIMLKYPLEYQAWIDDPIRHYPPKGESLTVLNKRVTARMIELIADHREKTIALVTHGGVIKVILCNAIGCKLKGFWEVDQAHGTLSVIDYLDDTVMRVYMKDDTVRLFV